jgi:gamma-glutamyl-gamma-aminobutyrate hydrolase PuuD
VLEAFVAPDYGWVMGVQWHPEAMAAVDAVQGRLFDEFVRGSATYSERATQPRARSA